MKEIVRTLLDIFSGTRPLDDIQTIMDEEVVHKNFLMTRNNETLFEEKRGLQEWKTWAIILRKAVKNLRTVEEELFVRGNTVFAVFRWMADEWHPDIKGDPRYSNFVFSKYTIQQAKITATETCRQNYLFMFGTDFSEAYLRKTYKAVLGFSDAANNVEIEPVISGYSVSLDLQPGRAAREQMAHVLQVSDLGQLEETCESIPVFRCCSREDSVEEWSGPTVRVDAGTSSVIYAVAEAVKAIRKGRSNKAMVVTQDIGCAAAGVLLIQTAAAAMEEGRTIHGVVKGVATARLDKHARHERRRFQEKIRNELYGRKGIPPDSVQSIHEPEALRKAPRTAGLAGLINALRSLTNPSRDRLAFESLDESGAIGHLVLDLYAVEHREDQRVPVESGSRVTEDREGVAIIGMAGIMPGADTPDEFWDNLVRKKDLLSDLSHERWATHVGGDVRAAAAGLSVKCAGLLKHVDAFDALFFNLSPVEVEHMDPQQRLILQVVWQAIEHSAYTVKAFGNDRTAVYIGYSNQDYRQLCLDVVRKTDRLEYTGLENSMLANRVARFLNCSGPCQTLNTECASALVALHNAGRLILQGEIDQAIVGAVNVLVHPYGFKIRDENGLLTHDTNAHPFGPNANGYIRGEGAGAFVLKRLDKARVDQDPILAVLKGSAVNQSENTLSLTAPHVASQTNVIIEAWERAGVDPSTITYIEAHANGYEEGDVVEVSVLKNAFRHAYKRWGKNEEKHEKSCGITSVKSAIGHLEAASGASMLLKVIQSFQHNTMLGVQGIREMNPRIDLSDTPLFICREDHVWSRRKDKSGKPIPRRAGINSFGVGGTNAHVIIEEYIDPGSRLEIEGSRVPDEPYIIVLSAKNEERLKKIAENLRRFIPQSPSFTLSDLAYTLQVGREAMDARVAFVVSTFEELLQTLQGYLQGEQNLERFHTGDLRNGEKPATFAGEAGRSFIKMALAPKDLSSLGCMWVNGMEIDWDLLYGTRTPRRIALPTYPFERTRYWLPERETITVQPAVIHALLHRNDSTLFEQRFTSTFTGDEFFLADHVVKGRPVLPGVAYLEMARVAVEQAVGPLKGDQAICLKNVVWSRPIAVDAPPVRVHVGVFPEDGGELQYEIYAGLEGEGSLEGDAELAEEQIIHGQGVAVVRSLGEVTTLNVPELRAKMNLTCLRSEQCYAAYTSMGVDYGPAHRGIDEIYVGERQLLAKLLLPSSVSGTRDQFVLHPSVMDAALQASVGLTMASESPSRMKLVLPFALGALEIIGPCAAEMWGWVRYADGSVPADKVQKLDIDLCDGAGKIRVRMKGFSSRALERGVNVSTTMRSPAAKVEALKEMAAPKPISVDAGAGPLAEKALDYFRRTFAATLKLPAHTIETGESLEKYGINSVMALRLTNQLEKTFGSLSKTLFFEYQTIRELTGYFLESYAEKLREILSVDRERENREAVKTIVEAEPAAKKARCLRLAPMARSAVEAPESQALNIAIIGLAGRYPQARDLHAYWINLREGRDCITEVPQGRWDWRAYYKTDRTQPGAHYSKWGGFIDDVDKFDPLFFNISPREAELMDPQERLFLETVWMALEDAGYAPEAIQGEHGDDLSAPVGVYAGVMYGEYQLFGAEASLAGHRLGFAGSLASIANRVSYVLNLHGPSMTIDTMCSSSLTSLHLACQDLRLGRTSLGIAGGVNVSVHPNKYLLLSRGQFISSRGHCESFGEGGDGYIPGEGVGVALLKRLADAERDGDHIYGVIKGSAVNHGGKTNGYTVPNPNAQRMVIARALKESGLDPRGISYIEAHGTGTQLGDPIEITGLTKAIENALRERSSSQARDKQFCWIGSAKSNIGHGESAAGIAGVSKVLLQLQHGQIVPSLHSRVLNPHIDFEATPFMVNQELRSWERPVVDGKTVPRIAGISSFGAGGSNAHIIIAEYFDDESETSHLTSQMNNDYVIVLSAKNAERLKAAAQNLQTFILQHSSLNLSSLAYTLQVGREAIEERLGLVVSSLDELVEKLKGFLEDQDGVEDLYRGQVKRNKETLSVFAADEELQEAIEKWIQRGKLSKLLDLWVKGLHVDWNKLHGGTPPRRISLPTYPFARERYWVEVPALKSVARNSREEKKSGGTSVDQRSIRYLRKQWRPHPVTSGTPPDRTVAILTTEETRTLADVLSREFPRSQIVNLDDIPSRVQNPEKEWDSYAGCVDLVGCGKRKRESLDWTAWLQQLIERGHREGITLLGVTQGLESYQNPSIHLSGATRAGLYRMLGSEYAHLRSRHIDVDPATDEGALAKQIAREFFMDDDASEICYRKGTRYQAELVERAETEGNGKDLAFSDHEVLWITGGTRGLGYLCARHFVNRYGVKRLVLTGRDVLPPRDQWSAYGESNDSIAHKIRAVQALERLGVEVRVLSVSLSDESAVQACLQDVNESMGPIGGVIHCAGIGDLDNPAFIRKSPAGMQRVLEPKVTGLDILLARFQKEPLRFFILFSSVSAIVPSLAAGQSDYAMANAYMDYVAEAGADGFPLISIQWPSWQETGMGEIVSSAYRQTGLLSHTDAEGLQLLDQVLAHDAGPVILPAVVNPAVWQPERLMTHQREERVVPKAAPSPLTDSPKTSGPLVDAIHDWLIELFSAELKIDPARLEADTPFQDYGVDSVLLAQLLRKINQKLPEALDPSILFEYTTLESLAPWLADTQGEALSQTLAVAARVEESPASSDVAVIGMSCRFPGANNVDEYWRLLSEGRSAISLVPPERWENADHFYAGLIDTITHFDPAYFLIPEEDARIMDPQALLVLEESLKLFYHAGYAPNEIKGTAVGVYLGARSQYRPEAAELQHARNPIVAAGQNYLAGNVSQFFDLKGPSLLIDTACSSALVGMQLAIQALARGEIDSAVVGGVSLLTDDRAHRIFQQRNILSQSPAFHVFDQRASGVILGEGAGFVLLKKRDQAQKDGDTIYAVVKALAVNNDGRTAGPATPNIQAQGEVMQAALFQSGKNAEDIRYIEVNGSGSEVTDLLELKAIEATYRSSTKTPCSLGSMKPNIGHPLCAEGIAGFIKLVLMFQHKRQVPFLSGEEPLKHYKMDTSPFHFCRELTEWMGPLPVAALNCFADGGTNAHAILERWEDHDAHPVLRHPGLPPALKRVDIRDPHGRRSPEIVRPVLGNNGRLYKHLNPWAGVFDVYHPVLKNHKVYGRHVLPGLAYIDLLYQFFREKGYDYAELELRNLSIYYPLRIEPNIGITLDVQSSEIKAGVWRVQIDGREQRDGTGVCETQRYVTAEMHRRARPVFEERLDVEAIRVATRKETLLDDVYGPCRDQELIHTGMMKAEGTVYSLDDENVVQLSVSQNAMLDAADFMFHPALIDGSGIAARGSIPALAEDDRLFLPLFYESFRACELLQRRCVTRVALGSVRLKKELLYMSIDFFNESGAKIGELRNFINKWARDPGLINPDRKETSSAAAAQRIGREKSSRIRGASLTQRKLASPTGRFHENPPSTSCTVSSSEAAERFLKEVMASALNRGTDELDVEIGYYEMGLDSAMLLEVVTTLEKKLSIELTPTLLFEYTSIRDLAAYLTKSYGDRFEQIRSVPPEVHSGVGALLASESVSSIPGGAHFSPVVHDDIAIIGLAGRYPGANTLHEFRINLEEGRECITELPHDRWDIHRYFEAGEAKPGKSYSKWGGFIEDPNCFDPLMFNISPLQARQMDPQERLFLETAWATLEDAGYTRAQLRGERVGVFAGVMWDDYRLWGIEELSKDNPFQIQADFSSIANRVSYFFDFQGPSLAVDTACSSSLAAIHMACESIQHGESAFAVAGGVNVCLHPYKYIRLSQMGMLSHDGRCRSFGEGGEGYVPGEGVGAVLLKPLKKALEDGDYIYAVVKGSAINHGGKTNGFTVPSPRAHADVVRLALTKSGVDPRTISYIEAHGTGTSLGDPIELQGLNTAFERAGAHQPTCAIGSVKSNIGHLEGAAGIAAVTKVLLQMKHKKLFPSLHAERLNPGIPFEGSRFRVQRELVSWPPPEGETGDVGGRYPRRAGISSFGAGGTNVHMILEEFDTASCNRRPASAYVGSGPENIEAKDSVLIPLSARNEDRLYAAVINLRNDLRAKVDEESVNKSDLLVQVAYTLQTGREAMEERVALLVPTMDELIKRLTDYAEKHTQELRGVFRGNVHAAPSTLNLLTQGQSGQDFLRVIMENRELDKLAQLWVSGIEVDWSLLYRRPIGRIPLPSYPFERKTYWFSTPSTQEISNYGEPRHPLLDGRDNASGLNEGVVYRKTLFPTDPVVHDHRIKGRAILPGVGHLEMARAAIEKVDPVAAKRITRVRWREPLALNEERRDVRIVLRNRGTEMHYEIRDAAQENGRLYSEGEYGLTDSCSDKENDSISIRDVQARCDRQISRKTFYDRLHRAGMEYGPYFQSVKQVWVNGVEALSFLSLSPDMNGGGEGHAFHPALMDGALQTIAGVNSDIVHDSRKSFMPFAVDAVDFLAPPATRCYAYVQEVGPRQYNVMILTEDGKPCVVFHGVVMRELSASTPPARRDDQGLFYVPRWRPLEKPIDRTTLDAAVVLNVVSSREDHVGQALREAYGSENVFTIQLGVETDKKAKHRWEVDALDPDALLPVLREIGVERFVASARTDDTSREQHIPIIYFFAGTPEAQDDIAVPDHHLNRDLLALARLVKGLAGLGLDQVPLHFKLITQGVYSVKSGENLNPLAASVHGLFKVIGKEFPHWKTVIIDMEEGALNRAPVRNQPGHGLVEQWVEEPCLKKTNAVALRDGVRYQRVVLPAVLPPVTQTRFKARGVYFLVGGAGAIGVELSRYLSKTFQARLVWIGRSKLDAEKKARLTEIQALGGEVLYIAADLTSQPSMEEAVEQAQAKFGRIHGVIHAAIVLDNEPLKERAEQTLLTASAPKIRGSLILYKLFQKEQLDFMMFFSSASAFEANMGQSGYVAGCNFKDAFARWMRPRVAYPVKTINWGYWDSTGRKGAETLMKRLTAAGIKPIQAEEGMNAVERVLAHAYDQMLVLKAEKKILENMGVDFTREMRITWEGIPPLGAGLHRHHMNTLPLDVASVDRCQRGFDKIDNIGRYLLLHAFQRMGVFTRAGERYRAETLKIQLGFSAGYSIFYETLLDVLERAGFIGIEAEEVIGLPVLDDEDLRQRLLTLKEQKEELIGAFPDMETHLRLLWHCLDAYPYLLTGKKGPMEVLFPGGDKSMVEGIYTGNYVSDLYNRMVAHAVREWVRLRLGKEPQVRIKILEIGAGTGGTSRFVLEALQPYRQQVRYVYSDISKSFIQYGEKTYGEQYPFTSFNVLNIETDLESQGFRDHEVDLVLCSNVLHATRRLSFTLSQIGRLLKAHGPLIFNEGTRRRDFITMIFGLTDGWWVFEDSPLRIKGAPLLNTEVWKGVLRTSGFDAIQAFGLPEFGCAEGDQHVIWAEHSGFAVYPVKGKGRTPSTPRISLPSDKPTKRSDRKESRPTIDSIDSDCRKSDVVDYVKTVFSEVLEMEKTRIDEHATFEQYGVDSLVMMDLNKRFEKDFGKLSATLLFEYMTVAKLSHYFMSEHRETLLGLLGSGRPGREQPLEQNGTKPELEEYSPSDSHRNKELPVDLEDGLLPQSAENLEDLVGSLSDRDVRVLIDYLQE